MADVVDLTARRAATHAARSGGEVLGCATCGGEWFELDARDAGLDRDTGAVTLSADRTVTGWCGTPRCLDCGELVAALRISPR
ncbi:hypothetical protein ACWPN4_22830 [Gordonia polyisoprenivorans]